MLGPLRRECNHEASSLPGQNASLIVLVLVLVLDLWKEATCDSRGVVCVRLRLCHAESSALQTVFSDCKLLLTETSPPENRRRGRVRDSTICLRLRRARILERQKMLQTGQVLLRRLSVDFALVLPFKDSERGG
jgi:hypothetical protein